MKFKVGDKVRVKPLEWYHANKDECGDVQTPDCFMEDMAKFCGKILTITKVWGESYKMLEDDDNYSFDDEMLEDEAITGTGNEIYTVYEPNDSFSLHFSNKEAAEKVCKALNKDGNFADDGYFIHEVVKTKVFDTADDGIKHLHEDLEGTYDKVKLED